MLYEGLIGIGATVLNGAVIGENCLVGAQVRCTHTFTLPDIYNRLFVAPLCYANILLLVPVCSPCGVPNDTPISIVC